MAKYLKKIYLGLIVLFLYLPIGVLIVSSFNNTKVLGKWGGFTFDWYKNLFENEAILNSLRNTLLIAVLAATIATILGVLGCVAISKMKRGTKSVINGVTNIPMLNAEIVTGLAFMLLFLGIGMKLTFNTLLIAHITFCIPYVVLSVMPKIEQSDRYMYEAARDLGATPLQAFFQITLPEIMPGVLSGFVMAFTMSIDDFVITYFTRGSGIDTLSTKIYTEVKKGIKPEMYALSTLLFVTVFILMILANKAPSEKREKKPVSKKKRIFTYAGAGVVAVAIIVAVIVSAKGNNTTTNKELYVYNWGEYIDPEVITMFEEKTGYKVYYEEFETNEDMYTIVERGARIYDVICPSDYMIAKMIENGLLAEIDYSNIPNLSYIGEEYMELSKGFDPENKYSVPYCYGTVGIMYNTTMVDDVVDSWDILFDEKYSGQILMQASVRDAYCVALSELGYSINTLNENELKEATELLIDQKPLVQAYVIDQVRDKMIDNRAAIGVIYSGEAEYMREENADLEYVVPKEGTNFWVDSWVIPSNAENKEAAEAWINFMCEPEIALLNFEYILYASPNTGVKELIEDEALLNSQALYPSDEVLERCAVYEYLGEDGDAMYDKYWTQVGAASSEVEDEGEEEESGGSSMFVILNIVGIIIVLGLLVFWNVKEGIKERKRK